MKKLIVIAGPTASGKTALAIKIAMHYGTEIISADSRQCYKELNIGVARPSEFELQQVPHHFIASHSITENITAGQYERLALSYCEKIFETNDVAVLVGGTGLYIKALCEGMDDMPAINTDIDKEVNTTYNKQGIEYLNAELEKYDPEFLRQGENQNPHRMIRALVFAKSTSTSILEFRTQQVKQRNFDIEYYVIDISREILYERINARVLQMLDAGLLNEVKSLQRYQLEKNLQTVGYTEIFAHLNNDITLERAISLIQQNSRHYAKRQVTWFKKQYPTRFMNEAQILTHLNCKP
jgi:tRNA dimethylallyltransferase